MLIGSKYKLAKVKMGPYGTEACQALKAMTCIKTGNELAARMRIFGRD